MLIPSEARRLSALLERENFDELSTTLNEFDMEGEEALLSALTLSLARKWVVGHERLHELLFPAAASGREKSPGARAAIAWHLLRGAASLSSEMALLFLIDILPRDSAAERTATIGMVLSIIEQSRWRDDETTINMVVAYLMSAGVLSPSAQITRELISHSPSAIWASACTSMAY